MSDLINQLKSEHQQISLILTEVNNLGITTYEGQIKLISVKNLLFKHLQKENEELFPVLNAAAKNNRVLKTNMQVLSLEMRTITGETAHFFQKHEGCGAVMEFNRDFIKIFTLLLQRFAKEEKVLYSEYIRIKRLVKSFSR